MGSKEEGGRTAGRSLARRLALACGAGATLLAAALLAAGLLLPRLVNVETVKARLFSEVSSRLGGRLEAGRVALAFYPIPRVTLHDLRLRVPGRLSLDADAVTLYPELLPLLRGVVRLSALDVDRPRAWVRIPEVPFPGEGAPSLAETEEKLARALAAVARAAPGTSFCVRAGSADLDSGAGARFRVQGLDARVDLPPSQLRVRLRCASDVAADVDLELRLDPASWRGQGRLAVRRLRPGPLVRYTRAGQGVPVDVEETTAEVKATAEGRGRLSVTATVEVPGALVRLGSEDLRVTGARLKGAAAAAGGGLRATLDGFTAESPRLDLRGSYAWSPAEARASAEVRGRGLDVGLARRVALALGPKVEAVKIACDVVRGGALDGFAGASEARSPSGLLRSPTLRLRGSVRGVALHLPWVGLDVSDAAGEVEYRGGVLTGTSLSGATDGATARDSSLRLGFTGKRRPFHLDLGVTAALDRVVPLLRKLVPNKDFQRELAQVSDVRGTASGRLVVGEWLEDLTVRVSAWDADLACRYGRGPLPLALHAAAFEYRGDSVSVGGLRGTAGASSFQGLAGSMDWSRTPALRLTAGAGRLALAELHPWLSTFPAYRAALKDFGPPAGTLAVSSLSADGPVLKPQQWRFSVAGVVEGFAIRSVHFPDTLRVASGRLLATERGASLSDATVRLLDAAVRGRAEVKPYGGPSASLDAAFEGRIGRRAASWLAATLGSPKGLRVGKSLSVRNARLLWTAGGGLSYAGEHLLEAGPELAVALRQKGDLVSVDRLALRDAVSSASASASNDGRGWHVGFRGLLRGQTLDRLLEENPLLQGFLEGEFQLDFDPSSPADSSLRGAFRLGDLDVPLPGGAPLRVEKASLRGAGKRIEMEEGRLSLGGQQAEVTGSVTVDRDRIVPALTLSAREIDGEKLLARFGGRGPKDRRKGPRVEGTVAVDIGRLRYGRYVLAPVTAQVRFGEAGTAVRNAEATLCGIELTGGLDVAPGKTFLEVSPSAKGADLQRTLDCLGYKTDTVSGAFSLSGSFTATASEATPAALLKGSDGKFTLKAENGRFRRFGLLAKILAVVNVTEVLRGRLPDLGKEGFGFRKVRSGGRLEKGKVVFDESTVDGDSVNVFWDGNVDLVAEVMDLTVVVSPFKTADAIVSRIPIVNYLLGRTLVSVPVYVGGDLPDPTVIPLSPSAVGKGLLGIMGRTLLLPYKLIQPLLPGDKDEQPQR